jgi:hypothetical protein
MSLAAGHEQDRTAAGGTRSASMERRFGSALRNRDPDENQAERHLLWRLTTATRLRMSDAGLFVLVLIADLLILTLFGLSAGLLG